MSGDSAIRGRWLPRRTDAFRDFLVSDDVVIGRRFANAIRCNAPLSSR